MYGNHKICKFLCGPLRQNKKKRMENKKIARRLDRKNISEYKEYQVGPKKPGAKISAF
jgi:hypothetical protein